ncbi:T9SS type A sorting domain-containing protein [Pedobacter nutrimenti]|uniref:T9SS type A sorting domain-containing protein n=1 Tax=Pedobacter nutrimenti TaxID=1241337 RepID=UPI00292F7729|nr:T9SS type A sorting domain-containing protein [Pedobacter nutrimenti]
MSFEMIFKGVFYVWLWLSFTGPLCLAQTREGRLKITLSCGDFSDQCILVFKKVGEEGATDRDALKIGEGYISVAILGLNQQHFSIQEKPVLKGDTDYGLFVKGFPSEHYQLRIEGMDVLLQDKVEKHLLTVPSSGAAYHFSMDIPVYSNPERSRFTLHFEPSEKREMPIINQDKVLTVYPNPWKEKLTIRFKESPKRDFDVLIRDLSGGLVWSRYFNYAPDRNEFILDCGKQSQGIYFLQVLDAFQHPVSETIKLIHE